MLLFNHLIERCLTSEGGYVNNPADPGGETNWGISKRSYPELNIKALTRDQAIEIYRVDFWNRVHGDELPPSFAFQALDAAINSGIVRTIMWMQWAAGVADDGHWGPVTREAIAHMDPADLVLRFLAARLDFMTRLVNWPNASRGWARRIAANMIDAAKDNPP